MRRADKDVADPRGAESRAPRDAARVMPRPASSPSNVKIGKLHKSSHISLPALKRTNQIRRILAAVGGVLSDGPRWRPRRHTSLPCYRRDGSGRWRGGRASAGGLSSSLHTPASSLLFTPSHSFSLLPTPCPAYELLRSRGLTIRGVKSSPLSMTPFL